MKDSKLADNAYKVLKEELILGKFLPGDKMTETALAERLKMSRTPIREALRRLERDGLVEFAGSRAFVRRYSMEEVSQLYELRQMLEVHAAVEAAGRIRSDALGKLEFCCQEFDRLTAELEKKRAAGEDCSSIGTEIALNDFNFHMIVIAQSANSFIRKLSLDLRIAMLSTFRAGLKDPTGEPSPEMLRQMHREMYCALKERDSEKVRELFTFHISNSRRILAERFRKTPEECTTRSILRETMEHI